jgi:putative ABC transport system ATP-binding protein
MTVVLKTRNLSKTFGSGAAKVHAVNKVSLSINAGEILLIMGPSGSGKTTFLSILGGLLSADSGEVVLNGVDITKLKASALPDIRAKTIGFIFQSFNLLEALNVEENILFPATLIPGDNVAAGKRCNELMALLGLQHRKDAFPQTLSGGEKQRVAIARALIKQPTVILADEPTGNLDSQSGQEVMMLLHDIARDQGVSVLIVTHDPRVEDIADRILWLEDGKITDTKSECHQWVTDPVCQMRVDERRALHFAEYQQTRYAFCSDRCRQRFVTEPQKYVSQ